MDGLQVSVWPNVQGRHVNRWQRCRQHTPGRSLEEVLDCECVPLVQHAHRTAEFASVHLRGLELRTTCDRTGSISLSVLVNHAFAVHATAAACHQGQLAMQLPKVVPQHHCNVTLRGNAHEWMHCEQQTRSV